MMPRRLAVVVLLLARTLLAHAADQPILGTTFEMKDRLPGHIFENRLKLRAKDKGMATLVGDPVAHGARLGLIVNGSRPSREIIDLEAGQEVWTGSAGRGFRYRGGYRNGLSTEVTVARKGAAFVLSVDLAGNYAVRPPAPGTDACAWFGIRGGDTYFVRFADGTIVNRGAELFRITRPTQTGTCCTQDRCQVGPAMMDACDPCIADICERDPFCCIDGWDALCVAEVERVCGITGCPRCGNDVVEAGEVCDGSAGCAPGETCTACGACASVCGDGLVGPDEACDDGAGCGADEACDATCSSCTTCPATTSIPSGGGTFTGVTSGASNVAGRCAATATAPEQTFSWTPATSGVATIQTCGSALDTVVYLRTGSCGGANVACDDDTCGFQSSIRPVVVAGQPYTIVVDGFDGSAGAFTLTVTPP